MSMWRLAAAAMAARSPSSELTTMSLVRARQARVPVALALVSSRVSTSHPARSRVAVARRFLAVVATLDGFGGCDGAPWAGCVAAGGEA